MSKPSRSSDIDVPESVVADLMTESEVKMIKNRWKVVILLSRGLSVRKVAQEVSVGTDTVVRMSKILRQNAQVRGMAKKAKLEVVKRAVVNNSEASKWVFGQVGRE